MDDGRTSSTDSDLPQSITPGTDASGEEPPEPEEPPELGAGVAGAEDEPPGAADPVATGVAVPVATGVAVPVATGVAVGDCAVEAADAGWVEPGTEVGELEPCALHPALRIPTTARAVPVSNVRRAAILVILLHPLSASTVHVRNGSAITKALSGQ